MATDERTALGSVLAAIAASVAGEPLATAFVAVCDAARALGARDAWIVLHDPDEVAERIYGGSESGPPSDADSFDFTSVNVEGRIVVTGAPSRARSEIARLAPVALAAAQAERMREALRRQAMRDPLTQLVNRLGLDDLMRRDVERAHRAGAPISIVALDIDRLGRINETYGRVSGDAAIAEVAEILRRGLRMVDVAARIGGGEFCAVLPGAGPENAREVAERLRCAIAATHIPGAGTITATFGVASLNEHAANGAALLLAAQAAMSTGKRRGRNRVDLAIPLTRP